MSRGQMAYDLSDLLRADGRQALEHLRIIDWHEGGCDHGRAGDRGKKDGQKAEPAQPSATP